MTQISAPTDSELSDVATPRPPFLEPLTPIPTTGFPIDFILKEAMSGTAPDALTKEQCLSFFGAIKKPMKKMLDDPRVGGTDDAGAWTGGGADDVVLMMKKMNREAPTAVTSSVMPPATINRCVLLKWLARRNSRKNLVCSSLLCHG